MGEFVRVETDQAVATIRLDRPPMNALNAQVQGEIAAAAAQVAGDPAVLSTADAVVAPDPSWKVFITPAVLLVVMVLVGALAVGRTRRARGFRGT